MGQWKLAKSEIILQSESLSPNELCLQTQTFIPLWFSLGFYVPKNHLKQANHPKMYEWDGTCEAYTDKKKNM